MRWLFFVLVFANLVYFAWVSYLRPTGVITVVSPALEGDKNRGRGSGVILVSELDSASAQVGEDVGSLSLAGGGKTLLGGFLDRQRIEALKQRLLSFGIAGKVVQVEVEAEKEFWVYLAPLASRAATLRLLKELQARKLDGFLITQGELADGISLGIFPQEATAKAVYERVKLAGYDARLREITRSQNAYWFEVEASGQRLLDEGMLAVLLEDFPGLQHRQQ